MKILITGAFGFVGSNLSAYLAQRGHRLVALDVAKKEPSAYSEFFSWGQLDRIDWGTLDAVIHLAGKAHDTRNAGDPQSYFDVNVGLTQRVIEKAQKVFILFSSVKAVADRVNGVLTEEAEPVPGTPYGRSKLEAEKMAQSVTRAYILRPCMIHGPGNKGNLNLLYGVVRRGLPWPLGAFENQRSFASIENVCAVVEGLLKGDAPPGVYQVADDEALSTNELIRLIAESAGRKAHIWMIPTAWIRMIARFGDMVRLPLNSERLKKLTESYVVSNEKIKNALRWETMPIRAKDGLKKTLVSFTQRDRKEPQINTD